MEHSKREGTAGGTAKWIGLGAVIAAAAALLILGYFLVRRGEKQDPSRGRIFLYGEKHGVERILDREFELWSAYYQDGMRDLFVELPYYTAEYMNLWMKSGDDEILDALYQDWAGTAMHAPEVAEFYRRIKERCPETVFHGTDVGHQYDTTGARFLAYLESTGQRQSETYRLAQENIRQGQRFYRDSDYVYRENAMVENFIRAFDALGGADVMGIYGSAHTGVEAKDTTNSIPCMANQLHKRYGAALFTEDLSPLALNDEPYRTDTMEISGKTYTALYFGQVDLSAEFPQYQYREFWRLEDAYGDFKDCALTGDVLPYHNYPMPVEAGQVFVIKYTMTDGSVVTEYLRSDGNTWQGMPTTEAFLPTP